MQNCGSEVPALQVHIWKSHVQNHFHTHLLSKAKLPLPPLVLYRTKLSLPLDTPFAAAEPTPRFLAAPPLAPALEATGADARTPAYPPLTLPP
eukprot:1160179-Pelagomonas_calceolata.AAC.10